MNGIANINDLFLLFKDKDIFDQFGLHKIGVFGSLARGEHFNDIDLFIEEEIDFKKLLRLKKMLEKETGFPVDIMQKKYAEPVILYRALKDMRYAATS